MFHLIICSLNAKKSFPTALGLLFKEPQPLDEASPFQVCFLETAFERGDRIVLALELFYCERNCL